MSRSKAKPGATRAAGKPAGVLAVVGIGASAGGLDALRRFFSAAPADSGMAFVVIQHLDPEHKSETASLLGRCTTMPVAEARGDQPVESNHVYVIPPNAALAVRKQRLHLSPPAKDRGFRTPIDFLFRSLAEEYLERSIGIVLSGTGSDGTLGLEAIKGAGGLTVAQDPATAEHDGMPRSAIVNVGVDFVLPVEKMPQMLVKYAQHPYLQRSTGAAAHAEEGRDYFQSILNLLRSRAKFDFNSYKPGTLRRRVHRRMSLRHVIDPKDYLELLYRDSDEVKALTKDLLICVTHFFRDPEAWKALQKEVIRPLVKRRSEENPIRVWAPGCATGEEAYSIVMLLMDELAAAKKTCRIQVFASDVSKEACESARRGSYPENIAADIPARRLNRYFTHENGRYLVREELRNAVVFAEHNLLAAPPFSRLDLITCRNLLIYLEPASQKKVLALFHYALKENGYLFLGNAETVGEPSDQFAPVSRKWRIYRRIGPSRPEHVEFPLDLTPAVNRGAAAQPAPPDRFKDLVHQIIVDRFAPACMVVNRKNEILYTCGPTEHYLAQPTGVMQTDLLAWAQSTLRPKLRAALHQARTNGQAVTIPDAQARHGKAARPVAMTVEPLKAPRQADGLTLVSFRETPTVRSEAKRTSKSKTTDDESVIHQLEDELQATHTDLRSTIDQLESSNEQLRVSNEEVVSVNEELQSTNEELETSKEELQSLNEELSTVNSQLQTKVEELESKTNDLTNLLGSTEIATLFLDRRFQVKWFTAPTTKLLRLRESDVGRPISDFAQKFTGDELLQDAKEVLRKLAPAEKEVLGQDGRWYLRRVLPYRGSGNRVEGVVITFVDINRIKIAEEDTRRLAVVLRNSNDAIILQNLDGKVLTWNQGAERMLGYTQAEALHMNISKITPPARKSERQEIVRRLLAGEPVPPMETRRLTRDGRLIDVSMTITALTNDHGQVIGYAKTMHDITQWKQSEEALRESEQRFRHMADTAPVLIWMSGTDKLCMYFNKPWMEFTGRTLEQELGNGWADGVHPDDLPSCLEIYATSFDARQSFQMEYRLRNHDGEYRWIVDHGVPRYSSTGEFIGYIGSCLDITDRKNNTAALHELNQTLEQRVTERSAVAEEQAKRLRELAVQLLSTEEQERRALAADLHDNLAQVLHVIKMKLAELLPDAPTSERRQLLEQTDKLVDQANAAARSMTYQLSPPILHELGLVPALEWLSEEMKRLYKLEVQVEDGTDEKRLDERTRDILFRAIRELLVNVAKHARADRATVRIRQAYGQIVVAVEDRGIGFEPKIVQDATRRSHGFGLFSIRERLEYLGGKMEIQSTPGKMTTVTLTMPIVSEYESGTGSPGAPGGPANPGNSGNSGGGG